MEMESGASGGGLRVAGGSRGESRRPCPAAVLAAATVEKGIGREVCVPHLSLVKWLAKLAIYLDE